MVMNDEKEDEFSENFSQMVLRFTDSSYDELKKAGTSGGAASLARARRASPGICNWVLGISEPGT